MCYNCDTIHEVMEKLVRFIMPMLNPRINVTFNLNDAEILKLISKKKRMSMSALIRKVMEDWLEDYEDLLLIKRAKRVEKVWFAGGCKTISHEELCQELDIGSIRVKTPKKTSNITKIYNQER